MPRVVAKERELGDGRAGSTLTRILVIEDDDGDALLVEEMLRDADERFQLVRARTLAEALAQVGDAIDCAVLDLGLPDAAGMNPLAPLLDAAGDVPVVVLTGLIDRHAGKAAVAAGAQDYLVKGEVSGDTLGHALRYAMERKAAVAAGRQSLLAERRQLENEHLARGLVPRPILADTPVAVVTRYRPGGPEALLGGDFFDVIECPDGTVRLLIGDVCGHGPDEAAIGVALASRGGPWCSPACPPRRCWRAWTPSSPASNGVTPSSPPCPRSRSRPTSGRCASTSAVTRLRSSSSRSCVGSTSSGPARPSGWLAISPSRGPRWPSPELGPAPDHRRPVRGARGRWRADRPGWAARGRPAPRSGRAGAW